LQDWRAVGEAAAMMGSGEEASEVIIPDDDRAVVSQVSRSHLQARQTASTTWII